ncbi:MAG: hypothetical protein AAFQ68_14760, partial [Bacteroidota bacterium]
RSLSSSDILLSNCQILRFSILMGFGLVLIYRNRWDFTYGISLMRWAERFAFESMGKAEIGSLL